MSEWKFTVNLQPVPTPRPSFRYDPKNKKTITYYQQSYIDYMDAVKKMLEEAGAYNQDFYNVMSAKLGVKAELYFYLKVPKGQKRINNIMRTTAPDLDNLIKSILDSIFKGLKIKDSRITMIQSAKFQVLDNPRTEIILKGVD